MWESYILDKTLPRLKIAVKGKRTLLSFKKKSCRQLWSPLWPLNCFSVLSAWESWTMPMPSPAFTPSVPSVYKATFLCPRKRSPKHSSWRGFPVPPAEYGLTPLVVGSWTLLRISGSSNWKTLWKNGRKQEAVRKSWLVGYVRKTSVIPWTIIVPTVKSTCVLRVAHTITLIQFYQITSCSLFHLDKEKMKA